MNRVYYKSKDGQTFEYISSKRNQAEAIKDGYKKIQELNYDSHGYIFDKIEKINRSKK